MKLDVARITILPFLLWAGPVGAQCAAAPGHPTLTVQGTAVVGRPPASAELTVSVETRGPTLEAVTGAHRARVAQAAAVLDRLKGDGVSVDDGSFGLLQERSPPLGSAPPDPSMVEYRAVTRYGLAVAKLDRLDGLVTAIALSGLFEIGLADFSAADPAGARDAARRAAVSDARRRAETYADAAGLRLDGVDCMAEGAPVPGGGAFRVQAGLAMAPSVGVAPPKLLEFTDEVTMVWRLASR